MPVLKIAIMLDVTIAKSGVGHCFQAVVGTQRVRHVDGCIPKLCRDQRGYAAEVLIMRREEAPSESESSDPRADTIRRQ